MASILSIHILLQKRVSLPRITGHSYGASVQGRAGTQAHLCPNPRLHLKRQKVNTQNVCFPSAVGRLVGEWHIGSNAANTQSISRTFLGTHRGNLHHWTFRFLCAIIITHLGDQKYLYPHWLPLLFIILQTPFGQFFKIKLTFKCWEMSPQQHSKECTDAITSLFQGETSLSK